MISYDIFQVPGIEFIIFSTSTDLPEEYKSFFKVVDLAAKKESIKSPSTSTSLNMVYLKKKFESIFRRLLANLKLYFLLDFGYFILHYKIFKRIEKENLDTMIFLTEPFLSFYLNYPSINIIFDLQHRVKPEFPEVGRPDIYNLRDYHFKKMIKASAVILVDSEVGKEDVINFYNTDRNKIIVLPYLAPNYLNRNLSSEDASQLLSTLSLPKDFVFYPAQFWPHKNHLNIVKALKYLKDKGEIVNVVLSGSKKEEWGMFEQMMSYVKEHGLEKQVYYVGYVDNATMSALYKCARALIMPTFFGPTNIPVLEAWVMGCPVIYSNIRGCREQLGDAGLLIDPQDPEDIGRKISSLWNNEELRKDLIQKGFIRVSLWTFTDFAKRIQEIIKYFLYATKNNTSSK
jgi:glycosyltransferase involved in cell wall biosynthesis